ncbi:hypothetical protein [Nocardioides sp.]|uniref:hypothetical protein n=1 Tax=Nocardioides sp. TaxID=35761 RepID=UPI003566E28B
MEGRADFRFVVDGVELSNAQRAKIGSAIQRAGLQALTDAKVEMESPVLFGQNHLKLNPEWYGIWVLTGDLADRFGPRIEEVVQDQFRR